MRSDKPRQIFNKLIILLTMVWVISPLYSFGDENETLFARGNHLYNAAKYQEALNAYQKILSSGKHSAALYFNMGDASFRSGDLPSAMLYFEKAAKLSPGDPDIKANIRFTDQIEEVPEFFLTTWWKSVCLAFPANTLTIISLMFVMGGSVLLIVYFYAHHLLLKKSAFYASIIAFLIGFSTVYVLREQHRLLISQQTGIVFSNPVYLKSSPSAASKPAILIHAGLKVIIVGRSGSWLKVQLVNGKVGWMPAADLREI